LLTLEPARRELEWRVSQILIIGYGNALRADDAVGYRAAEQLR